MTLPKYEQLMLPLLRRTAAIDGEVNIAMVLPDLAREFELTEEEVQQRLPSGGQTYFANRCHWAKFYLSRAGLLEAARRGYFVVTDEGRKILTDNPAAVRDRKSLMQIPQFAKWWQELPESKAASATAGPSASVQCRQTNLSRSSLTF